jgi:hypothetical protein
VIIRNGKGLDSEDLAAGPTNVDVSASLFTRIATGLLALPWILLLISATGEKENTWFLLVVRALGILQNTAVAGCPQHSSAFGVHLTHHHMIGQSKVMDALFEVEEKYSHVGASMLKTFFPGKLRPREKERWAAYEITAQKHDDDEGNKEEGAGEGGEGDKRAIDYGASLMKRTSLVCKFHYTKPKRYYYPLYERKCLFPEGPFA